MIIAIVATILAVGTIAFLGIRLVNSLVLYRLMRAVRSYPNVAMALALAARGDDSEADKFRVWVLRSVESNGWENTDEALGEMLRRVYPLGAINLFPDEGDTQNSTGS